MRGGSWSNSPGILRSSFRKKYEPEEESPDFGVRCVWEVSP